MHAIPAGAPLALVEQHLMYAPAFAAACGSFVWGSVGYVQMCLECLRLLCYAVLGYVLPAWLLQQESFVAHVAGAAWRAHKPLAGKGAVVGAELAMGTDPGLWALRQVFQCSWQRFAAGGDPPLSAAVCLQCDPQRPAELRAAFASLRTPIVQANGVPSEEGACATVLAAPVLVVSGVTACGGSHDVDRASWELAPGVHAIVHDSARGGARLHDQVPADYRRCLDRCMADAVSLSSEQVAQLGTFRAADAPATESAPCNDRRHVDLVRGTWGAEMAPVALQRELAARQGVQGIVPGRLSARPAFYLTPTLLCAPSLLAAGCEALQACRRRRIWAGDHV